MFIKDGTYRDVSIAGLTAPIYEGTVLTESGAIAKADGSDAFGIVPENIYIMPPTKMTRVVIGGTIDLQDPANANVTISKAVQDALSADINFIPGAGALPVVDTEDNGKFLVVEEGKWSAGGTEVVEEAVGDWLDAHPEATTTVQDGSVTDAKLVQAGGVLSEVHDVRVGADGVTYASAGAAVRGQVGELNTKARNFIVSNNLVDKTKITDGYYVSMDTGILNEASGYSVTDYIFVEPLEQYSQTHTAAGGQAAFYDANKRFVSGILNGSTKTFTVPEGCYYMRNTLLTSAKETYAICKGESAEYSVYSEYLVVKDNTVDGNALKNKTLNIDKLSFTEEVTGQNLFNKDTAVDGYVVYTNGRISTSAPNYKASDYIAVEEKTEYTLSYCVSGCQTAFYDSSKTYISGILYNGSNQTFTTPANAAYLRTTTNVTQIDTFAVCKGHSAVYTPYEIRTIIQSDYLPATGKSEFNIVVAKDGSGDYTSLTDAVANASNGDLIFVKAGIYDDEEVEAWGKDITIIGEDMLSTVIKNGLNTYSRPPMEMSCGRLSNVTVYAYDGGGESLDQNGWLPYSIHIDNDAQFENTLHIDNCVLMSDKGCGIGIGLRKGELRFDNCKFVSRDLPPFYFHDTTAPALGDGQYLTLKDCIGTSKTSQQVMRINSQKTENSVVYPEFINCIFVSEATDNPTVSATNVDNSGGTATEVGTFMNLINFYQVKTSRNNYPESLNYQV